MRAVSVAFAAAAALAVGLGPAACTSPPADPGIATAGSGTPTSTPGPGSAADQRKWAQCMRAHGVDVPDPGSGRGKLDPGSVDKRKLAAAQEACRQYDTGSDLNGRPPSPAELEQARKWAGCMREHGIDVPDPDPDGTIFGPPTDAPRGPVEAAEQACAPLAPRAGGTGSPAPWAAGR